MSDTYRKDKNGKTLKEGLKKKDGAYRCNCHYCVGVDRNELIEKIAEKELRNYISDLIQDTPNDLKLGETIRRFFS